MLARYRSSAHANLFDTTDRSVYDEMVAPDGNLRPQWAELAEGLEAHGHYGLTRLRDRVRRLVDNDGITYNDIGRASGSQMVAPSRWNLDGVPLMVSAEDWEVLEAGILQRSRLLDAILTDIYGERKLLTSGLIPGELVFGHRGYLRAAHGITMPGKRQLFLHGCDISKRGTGEYQVNADWTQAPSGAGYALADRRVISRALPNIFQRSSPRPLSPFASAMRLALMEAAPEAAEDPVVAILSPGTHSETAFDQAYLASVLGFPLVESADLVVREGKLWMRSLGKLKRIDVLLRRVDAEFSDPLDLRPDSRLGVVGLVEVIRRGAVSVVNTLGSGVLENPALVNFLPTLCRSLLDEELLLNSVQTYWGAVKSERSFLAKHLNSLIIHSTTTGETVYGPALTRLAREELSSAIDADPWKWVGQEFPEFSTAPVEDNNSGLSAASVAMRLFTVSQRAGFVPMVGGLGQIMDSESTLDGGVSSLKSIAAKDIWIRSVDRIISNTTGQTDTFGAEASAMLPAFQVPGIDVVSSPRVLSDLFWMGRYAERAEDMARLLIATRERYQEYRYRQWMDASKCLPLLVGALGEVTGTALPGGTDELNSDLGSEILSFTIDSKRSGSLAQSVERLGNSARAVRDQLSHDTWMVLGSVDRALAELAEASYDDGTLLAASHSAVLGGMLALSGLGAESMVHDPGWYLMDIGKRLERGLQLTALLSSTLTTVLIPAVEKTVTEAVLSATESSVIYRRRNRGKIRLAAVAQLLLFDEGNPRSLVFQLDALRVNLKALPSASGSSRAERLVEEMGARLRRIDPSDLEIVNDCGEKPELIELLDGIHTSLRSLSDVIMETQLSLPGDIQPLWGPNAVQELS
ncbi:MAG: circularly permuted type 2 ATP-grasp protein [Mycobacteriaceae bacterium]